MRHIKSEESIIARKSTKIVINIITFMLAIFIFIYLIKTFGFSHKNHIDDKSDYVFDTSFKFNYDPTNKDYTKNCVRLYQKIKDNPHVYRPPMRQPPESLHEAFQQNDKMPISSYSYIDQSMHNSNLSIITNDDLEEMYEKIKDYKMLGHGPRIIQERLRDYKHKIQEAHVLILGSETPWVEAILTDFGASKTITLDYAKKIFENKKMEWWQIMDYMDYASQNDVASHVDIAVSYSALQHSGLGRYGEPLSPDGDLEMLQMIHCMLKPNGILFLGIPVAVDRKGYIEFNKQRVYGNLRLKDLFDGWKILGGKRSDDDFHTVYILQKA